MNELFTYLFDEDVLKNKLREKWIKLYDFNFVDNEIIGGLLNTKKNLSDLLTFIYNKATASNLPVETKESQPLPKSDLGIASTTEKTKTKTTPQYLFRSRYKWIKSVFIGSHRFTFRECFAQRQK